MYINYGYVGRIVDLSYGNGIVVGFSVDIGSAKFFVGIIPKLHAFCNAEFILGIGFIGQVAIAQPAAAFFYGAL
ncbi:hypothetical protein D3H65_17965 [Paraflavitalea soli]|uniref:Uncharacterized protein n=1 Tax=Paraflavitalea soli TaxID=2315862 RepID=A0A3B7MMR3_9BACT|nr:hypothetical protein D3H65_17965 [Paraflavitalea soli]